MREIKFRAWDRVNKRMMRDVSTGTIHIFDYARTDEERTSKESDCDFMQFTGLHDSTGKEIYEGDIFADSLGRYSVVEYHSGSFWMRCPETLYSERLNSSHKSIIVGNNYETPELLLDNSSKKSDIKLSHK
jgi:hypothetical protein